MTPEEKKDFAEKILKIKKDLSTLGMDYLNKKLPLPMDEVIKETEPFAEAEAALRKLFYKFDELPF